MSDGVVENGVGEVLIRRFEECMRMAANRVVCCYISINDLVKRGQVYGKCVGRQTTYYYKGRLSTDRPPNDLLPGSQKSRLHTESAFVGHFQGIDHREAFERL
jgi:hypothetical protein